MSFDKLAVLFTGIAGILITFWFFLMKKEKTVTAGAKIDILVKGGYNPSRIKLKKNVLTQLVFTRTDPSSCLEEVIIPDFKKKIYLPLNQPIAVKITPNKAGEFEIVCGMNMFHGTLIVEE